MVAIKRRDFLGGLAAASGAMLLGCNSDSKSAPKDSAADLKLPAGDLPPSQDQTQQDLTQPSDAAVDLSRSSDTLAPTCGELTASNIEGPFFTANSPERSSLLSPAINGTKLVLTGRVLAPDCQLRKGAMLDFWQANEKGEYDNVGYTLRGHQLAADGSYRLETIIPGHYLNGSQYRPAHIHVKVAAPGTATLTTQLYFEGDPYNVIDPWYLSELSMTLTDGSAGSKEGRFDFVLPAA